MSVSGCTVAGPGRFDVADHLAAGEAASLRAVKQGMQPLTGASIKRDSRSLRMYQPRRMGGFWRWRILRWKFSVNLNRDGRLYLAVLAERAF